MEDLEKQKGTSSMLRQALCIIPKPPVDFSWSYGLETPNWDENGHCHVRPWNLTDDLEKQEGTLWYW